MAELIRCKACGLIISTKLVGMVCPACGVPRASFEPYTDRMSPRRRWWLRQHIHGVSVHTAQAFSMTLFPLIIGGMTIHSMPIVGAHLLATARTLAVVLPFSVLAAFLTGILDGKQRFKRLSPPFLRLKILVGTVFFTVTSAMAYLILTHGLAAGPGVYGILALNVMAISCGALLGKIGGMIHCAEMGGK